MHKKFKIIMIITTLGFFDIYGMLFDELYPYSSYHIASQELTLIPCDKPYRFGDLSTNPLTCDDLYILKSLEKEPNLISITHYIKYRPVIGKVLHYQHPLLENREKLDQIAASAISYNDAQLTKKLSNSGINFNTPVGNISKSPPIFQAKKVDFAKLLVSCGASLNAVDSSFSEGQTLLHQACEYDIPAEVLEYYLTTSDLNVDTQRTNDGYTPMRVLIENFINKKHLSRIQTKLLLLKAAGATIYLKNLKGETALEILIKNKPKILMNSIPETAKNYAELVKQLSPDSEIPPHPYKNETCSICLDNFDGTEKEIQNLTSTTRLRSVSRDVAKTICNHYYHAACLQEWLKTNNICPICRQDFTASSFLNSVLNSSSLWGVWLGPDNRYQ